MEVSIPSSGRATLTISSERKFLSRSGQEHADLGPGPEAEYTMLRGLEQAFTAKAGDRMFLVSMAWWQEWKIYTQYDLRLRLALLSQRASPSSQPEPDSVEPSIPAPRPGPVDNSDIAQQGQLRPFMIDSVNYTLLCADAWRYLHRLYGGGPEFARRYIEVGPSRALQVEIYPLQLIVEERGCGKEPYPFTVSKEATAGALRRLLGERMWVAPHNLRLWHSNRSSCKLLLDGQLGATLDDLRFNSLDQVFVQVRSPSGLFFVEDEPPPILVSLSSLWLGNDRYGLSSALAETRYEDSKDPAPESGVTGLTNLGNTCFMNSALQCLSNVPPLAEYFLERARWEGDVNEDAIGGTAGKLVQEFAKLLEKLWTANVAYTPPVDLKWTIGKYAPDFAGYRQHDTQELIAYLLGALHEDLNRVKHKVPVETLESDFRDDAVVARESWDRYLLREQSVVVDVFGGQFKSTVKCPECPRVSITFDPFTYLQLPLPGHDNRPVQVLFFPAHAQCVKLKVTVKKSAAVRDVLLGLAEQFPEASADDFEVFTTVRGYLQTQLKHATPLYNLLHASFNVYHLPAAKKHFTVVGLFRKTLPSGSHAVAGEPILLKLPHSSQIDQLYEQVHLQAAHLVDIEGENGDAAAASPSPSNPADAKKHKKNKNKKSRMLPPDYPFVLSVVSEKGTYCASESCTLDFCDGCSLPACATRGDLKFGSPCYLAIDYKSPYAFKTPIIHESARDLIVNPSSSSEGKSSSSLGVKFPKDCPEISLDQCFSLHCQEETLSEENSWYCNVCRKHQMASKKLEIFRLPDVCIVHLKRFYFTANVREKIETFVSYPIQGWDLSQYELCKDPLRTPPLYDLIGVINHFGGLGGGHYTAYCLNKIDQNWYDFNDAKTSLLDPSTVLSPSAYLLFYRRRGSPDQPIPQSPGEISSLISSHPPSSSSDKKKDKHRSKKNKK